MTQHFGDHPLQSDTGCLSPHTCTSSRGACPCRVNSFTLMFPPPQVSSPRICCSIMSKALVQQLKTSLWWVASSLGSHHLRGGTTLVTTGQSKRMRGACRRWPPANLLCPGAPWARPGWGELPGAVPCLGEKGLRGLVQLCRADGRYADEAEQVL